MTAKRIVVILGIIAIISFVALSTFWLVPMLQEKMQYDALKDVIAETSGPPFLVKPFDAEMQKTLGIIESTWLLQKDDTIAYSNVMRRAGISPTVDGMIQLLNYQMPDFSWTSPSENKKSLSMTHAKIVVVPMSHDNTLHVSADHRVALAYPSETVVFIYRVDKNGLSGSFWIRPEDKTEPDPSP